MKSSCLRPVAFTALLMAGNVNAATFSVTATNDSGAGTLRQAITDANASNGVDTIAFAISGAGPHTITPASILPTVADPVIIDGYTQAGSSSNTLATGDNAVLKIELNMVNANGGLVISAGNSTIRGLVINRNGAGSVAGGGIVLQMLGSNVVEGCFLGTDVTGLLARGNGEGVVAIYPSGNNLIGGTKPGSRNVISGNSVIGVDLRSGTNSVQGNFIGVDRTGTNALGNTGYGVYIFIHPATGASNIPLNMIGGDAPGAGNVIGANDGPGIVLSQDGAPQQTLIKGNFIGTDFTGTRDLGNGTDGINLTTFSSAGLTEDVIGDTTPNVIAFNKGNGIQVGMGAANLIAGNLIYSNVQAGVYVPFFTGGNSNNTITANSIFNNGQLGILLGDSPDPNDPCDTDTGSNHEQNYPVITAATSTVNSVTIAGFLDSAPSATYSLEFFANSVCDPSGFGEGQTFIGATNLIAGSNCTNFFNFTFPVPVADALLITATATDPDGNTSEFSACRTNVSNVVSNDPPQITCPANITTNTAAGTCARSVAFTATATGTPTPAISYRTNGVAVTSTVTFPKGVTTVSCTASNTAGTDQCTFTITVNDDIGPSIECSSTITTNIAEGETGAMVSFPSPTASDNCPGLTADCVPPSDSNFSAGTNTVICTAIDSAGETNTCGFSIIVIPSGGNIPPMAFCQDVIVDAVSNCLADVAATDVDFGSYDPDGLITNYTLDPPGPYTAGVVTPVTLTVTDDLGATASCQANIFVQDITPPTIVCPATVVAGTPPGGSNAVVSFTVTFSDDCTSAVTTVMPPSGSTFDLGTTTVSCTAVDVGGNTNGCSFHVIVNATPPEAHDLALIKLKAPKNINLKAATPALTKRVVVQIQNRSPHNEIITNFTGLVTVQLHSLTNACAGLEPTANLIVGPPNNPKTLKPKQKMNVFFDVMFTTNCVPDRLKGLGHEDYRYTATVSHFALTGIADTHTNDDVCPRLPQGVDPNPDGKLVDKGCGNKDKTTGQLGADVLTDVVVK